MAKYYLSDLAFEDLIAIAEYGDENYGLDASDKYQTKLKERFENIAISPLMYPPVDYIKDGYRRSVIDSYSIYYRLIGDMVEISRIIGRQIFEL